MMHGLGARSQYFVPDEADDFAGNAVGIGGHLGYEQDCGVLGDSLSGPHYLIVP
jgi:hypothetical protein